MIGIMQAPGTEDSGPVAKPDSSYYHQYGYS